VVYAETEFTSYVPQRLETWHHLEKREYTLFSDRQKDRDGKFVEYISKSKKYFLSHLLNP
jgi:hypothetical protein